ncbi:MAG: hypothetical protein ACJ74U_11230 [Jatrophihabitantaceae bacterium]
MRWDGLFADLEAQATALSAAERDAEIDDRSRSEVGRLTLVDRLYGAVGSRIRLVCRGELALAGQLARVHPEWLLLSEGGGQETLVALWAVLSVAGLGRLSAAPGTMPAVDSRFGLSLALRGIARDRSMVRLHLVDGGALAGTLDRVGVDFVELAVHPADELRRHSAVRQLLVVPIGSVAALRRANDNAPSSG